MEQVSKYVAYDGIEFTSIEACKEHERKMTILQVMGDMHEDDPSEAIIELIATIKYILGINIPDYNEYVEHFRAHKPCSVDCSLRMWISEHSSRYPSLIPIYDNVAKRYVALYGEPERD